MNKPKITIVAVNWWSHEFYTLLKNSAEQKAKNQIDLEFVIVDNSGELDSVAEDILKPNKNIGHGAGIDLAVKEAKGDYILALDIDSHILLQDWDEKLIKYFEDKELDYMGGEGGLLKPVRPCVAFFKRDWFIDGGYSFKPHTIDFPNKKCLKFDTGVLMYRQAINARDKTELFPYAKTEFKEVFGNEYKLAGERFVYHNWYGTRWFGPDGKLKHSKIDNHNYFEWLDKKKSLFKQL